LQLPNLPPLRSALGVIAAGFFVLPFGVPAQESSSPPPATVERTIIMRDPIPLSEQAGSLRAMDIPADLMKKEGANTPIEALRQIPFFVGTTATENDSSGGDGSAFINLYALGSNNVLTLINGRRAFSFSDINAIPIAALNRVEILDGGVYGSDSTAGVVNFIMLNGPGEKPYEGAELFALYGNTTDADAHVRQVYLRGGVTGLDGKVSIAAAAEYYSRANLFSRDREIAHTADLSNNPTGLGLGGQNSNSPTYAGRISVAGGATALGFTATGQLVLNDLTTNNATPGAYRRFDAALDPSQYNFRAFTPAIPAMEKASYFVTGRYKIFGEGLQLYGDITYSKVKQDNGLASTPFALTSFDNGLPEARNSQFNPAGNFLSSVRYRLQQELGNRESFFDKDYWRYTVGVNGDFNFHDNGFISRFGYDSGYVYSRFDEQRIDSGDVTRSQLRAAIAGTLVPGVFFNPFIGQNAPLVGNAPTYSANGVPTGVMAPYNNLVTAQAASYVGHSFFHERDWLGDMKMNAHLFPNLWNGGIDVFFGGEHRQIRTHQVPDATQVAGDQLFFTATPNTKFKQEVNSFFGEIDIPIITSTMNVSGVRALDVVGSFRYERYEDKDQYTHATASFDNNGSPQLGLRYQPSTDLTLRASWRQSTRPPTFDDLFAPMTQVFPPLFGLPPDTKFLDVVVGGNPNLSPEKTDAYSAGVVWSPQFFPGFMMTADWYQLFTTDLILDGNDFAQVLVTRNILAPLNDLTGCGDLNNIGLIRDPDDGTVFCINSPTGNAGKRHVQGLEVTAVYELPTDRFGKFTVSGGWNHFFTWKTQPGVGVFNSFLGNYNNGTLPLAPGAIPWNKAFLRGEWEWRHFDFVVTGNYIGDFRDDPSFNRNQTPVGGPDFTGRIRTVPSYITLDLQLSYEFVKPAAEPMPAAKDAKDGKNVMQTAADTSSIWQRILWGTKLTVGVNNAFDRNPPTVLAAFNDNYDTSLYSIRNRFCYIAFTKKF
jgi:iron complex outermembrane recepter protein